jgi:hypothetical protein
MEKIIFVLIVYFGRILLSQTPHEDLKYFTIITNMMDSVKNIQSLRFNLKSLERIEKGYVESIIKIKLQINPRKVYLNNSTAKLEVLYNVEKNKKTCLVNPHIFPHFNVSLDPTGKLMRKNQHFTMNQIGFDYVAKAIAMALSKEKNNLTKHLKYMGKVEKNEMICHLFIYENPAFSYEDYSVKENESIESVSQKLFVNEYMVRSRNKLFDEYNYLKKGTILKIPTFYCKKGIFYISEKNMLPISITIFDDIGVFESYDFSNLEINTPIAPKEFEKNYKDYTF